MLMSLSWVNPNGKCRLKKSETLAGRLLFVSVARTHPAAAWMKRNDPVQSFELALFVFGYIKGQFTTARPLRSAWQTVVVGGLAATAAFVIAKAIG